MAGQFGSAEVAPIAELYRLLRWCLPSTAKDSVLWVMETTPCASVLKFAILFSTKFTSTSLSAAKAAAAVEVVSAPSTEWAGTVSAALDVDQPSLALTGAALFVEYTIDTIVDAVGGVDRRAVNDGMERGGPSVGWPDIKKRVVEWYHSAFLVMASFGPIISEKIIDDVAVRHRASVDHLVACAILRGGLKPHRRLAQRWLRRAIVVFGLTGAETEGVFGLGLTALEDIM